MSVFSMDVGPYSRTGFNDGQRLKSWEPGRK